MSKHQTKVYLKPIGGSNFLIWFSQHVSFCPVLSYQVTNTQSTFQLALCALHVMLIYYTMPFFSLDVENWASVLLFFVAAICTSVRKKTRKDLFLSFKVINTVGIYSKYWVLSEGIKKFLLMHWFTIDTFYGFLSVRASLNRGLTSFRAKVQRLGKSKQAAHAWCCWIVSAQTFWLQKNHFLGTPFQDHKRLRSIFARQCDRC